MQGGGFPAFRLVIAGGVRVAPAGLPSGPVGLHAEASGAVRPRAGACVLLLLGLVLGLLLGVPAPAAAHSTLTGSEPASGAVLEVGPAAVRLLFDEPLVAGSGSVTVVGPDRVERVRGRPVVADAVATQPLQPLAAAGRYRVAYRFASSSDAHPVVGVLHFQVAAGAAAPAIAMSTDVSGSRRGSPGTVVGLLVVSGVLLAGGVRAVRRRAPVP